MSLRREVQSVIYSSTPEAVCPPIIVHGLEQFSPTFRRPNTHVCQGFRKELWTSPWVVQWNYWQTDTVSLPRTWKKSPENPNNPPSGILKQLMWGKEAFENIDQEILVHMCRGKGVNHQNELKVRFSNNDLTQEHGKHASMKSITGIVMEMH